jgi:hypothetical protein
MENGRMGLCKSRRLALLERCSLEALKLFIPNDLQHHACNQFCNDNFLVGQHLWQIVPKETVTASKFEGRGKHENVERSDAVAADMSL